MSQLVTSTAAPASTDRKAPWTVKVLSAVIVLLALVTSYGAIYFTFYFEDPDPGIGSWVFVTVFIAVNVLATVSAVALLRGSRTGWRVLVGYGVLGILWCIAKLVFWHETESLVFGAANIAALALLAARPTRRHAG
jgi:hypothetical protein